MVITGEMHEVKMGAEKKQARKPRPGAAFRGFRAYVILTKRNLGSASAGLNPKVAEPFEILGHHRRGFGPALFAVLHAFERFPKDRPADCEPNQARDPSRGG